MAQSNKSNSGNVLEGFIDFIREQGVVGLAVGIILGAAAKDVVDSLVKDIISPLIGLVFDAENLGAETFALGSGDDAVIIGWGNLASKIISFAIVAAVVYFVLNRFMKKLDKQKD